MMPALALAAVTAFVIAWVLHRARGQEIENREAAVVQNYAHSGSAGELQTRELVLRIFSPKDREFILLTKSPLLWRLYGEERRKVALHWVQRTSREISRIMRNHRLSSRQSGNLNVVEETKLSCQYLELRFLCVMLRLLILLFGPHALVDLAALAGELYQRLGRALPSVAVTTRVASSGNIQAR